MRQDEEVYTSRPAPALNHTFSSSFVDRLKDVSLVDAGRDAWSRGTAPVSSRGSSRREELVDSQQEDPVLPTLDSLSIKSDKSCSNNKLFSALEGLGLSAEDLELLLLDEKMVMVNTDRDHTPSLNKCLASNEILSYIHATPVSKHEGGQQVCPLPGMSPSPRGGTATYQAHAESETSHYLPQHMLQPSIAVGQPPAPLWEQPLHTGPGQPPPLLLGPDEEDKLADGSRWRPAGEEGQLCFIQPAWGTLWDKVPGLSPGAPCPQEPPRALQLAGDFPAVHPTQGDACQSFSLPSQCQGHAGPPSQPKPRHWVMNGLCGHSPDSASQLLPSSSPGSPWQDYVSPLLGSSAGFHGISQDLMSQHEGCLDPAPGVPTVHMNLNGLCSMETAGSGGSQEEMAPYSNFFSPSSYQLVAEKQLSAVPSVSQHSLPSSTAERLRSLSNPLETTVSSYGTYASTLGQESRHRVRASLLPCPAFPGLLLGVSAQGGTCWLVGRTSKELPCCSWWTARRSSS